MTRTFGVCVGSAVTRGDAGKWRGADGKKISRAEIPSGARHNRANDAGERYPANDRAPAATQCQLRIG